MQSENNKRNTAEEEDFSFSKMVSDRWNNVVYLWRFKFSIILIALIGGAFGAVLAYVWPPTYTAKLTFIVEDSKGGGGLLSGLASQIGFDIGSLGGGASSGMIAGDNVMQLLTSQKIVKKTILTPLDSGTYTLADKYADSYKLKDKWKDLKENTKKETIMFPADSRNYTRLQDSLLQDIIKRLNEKEISVSKPDKKLGFFALNATLKNEVLASLLCTRLIDEASEFYIQTRTKRLRTNVDRLQTRADSIGRLLNRKTYSAASANANLLDVNPAFVGADVQVEVQERDKRVLQTIYSEIIKNLEVSRTMLIQETPTFQIVDEPDMPLKKNKIGYLKGIVLGMLLFGLFYSMYILIRQPSEPKSHA